MDVMPELILVAFITLWVSFLGLPALFVAKARGRSPVGWFFVGAAISYAVAAAYGLALPNAPQGVAWLGVFVAPAILMSLPRLTPRRGAVQETDLG
jgi:hypothetical protein